MENSLLSIQSKNRLMQSELEYLKSFRTIQSLLNTDQILFIKELNNSQLAVVTMVCCSKCGRFFYIYLINESQCDKIGHCYTEICSLFEEHPHLHIDDTVIDFRYRNKKFGIMLIDNVIKYAKSIGTKKIYGEKSCFDTDTVEKERLWYHFWIEHFQCRETNKGFYMELL